MSRLLRTGLAVVTAFAVVPASAAEVVAEGTSSPRESPRALNGHVFQPSRLVPGPFSTTSFGTITLFGVGEAESPRYDDQGNQIGTRDEPVAAFSQGLDLDLRVTPDIALRLQVEGLVFAGTDGRSILVAGASARYGFLAGFVAGRDLGSRTRLAFVADAGVEPTLSVTVAEAVIRAIETDSFDEGGLFSTVNRVRIAPGLSFAWAPSPGIGFVAEGRYIWTRRVSDDETVERTGQGVLVGGTAELDLDPLAHWPFAVQAVYRGEFPVDSEGFARVDQAGLGFWYTRRVRLALGLEVVWRRGEIRPGSELPLDSDSALADVRFRYYW